MADFNKLVEGIRRFTDETFEGFEKFPATEDEAAEFWSRAVQDYLLTQVIPPPGGVVYAALAATAMKPAFKGFSAPFAAPVILPGAFAVAAATIAGSSVPVAVPPPAPLVIPPMPPVPSAAVGALVLATAVDLWFKTGLFGVPPTPPAPPWS